MKNISQNVKYLVLLFILILGCKNKEKEIMPVQLKTIKVNVIENNNLRTENIDLLKELFPDGMYVRYYRGFSQGTNLTIPDLENIEFEVPEHDLTMFFTNFETEDFYTVKNLNKDLFYTNLITVPKNTNHLDLTFKRLNNEITFRNNEPYLNVESIEFVFDVDIFEFNMFSGVESSEYKNYRLKTTVDLDDEGYFYLEKKFIPARLNSISLTAKFKDNSTESILLDNLELTHLKKNSSYHFSMDADWGDVSGVENSKDLTISVDIDRDRDEVKNYSF